MARFKLFIPLFLFAGLALLFFQVEQGVKDGSYSPQALPSARVDKPFPQFSAPDLMTAKLLDASVLQGRISLVNVWATWCPSCHFEHPFLLQMAAGDVPEWGADMQLLGVNYKDDDEAARAMLRQKGNPFALNIVDPQGRLGLDLGVTGAPETYLVDADGRVRFRYQGVLDLKVWQREWLPRIAALREEMAQ